MFNNTIQGIGGVELSVIDLMSAQKFLLDFGLTKSDSGSFHTLDRSLLQLKKTDRCSLDSITWNIDGHDIEHFFQKFKNTIDLKRNSAIIECIDPSGIKLIFQPYKVTRLQNKAVPVNGYNDIRRVNSQVPTYKKINPIAISHVVIETDNIEKTERFYLDLGFIVSDRLLGRGVFLRCNENAGHHDLFLIKSDKIKLHHIAFSVNDIYELFDGGKSMNSKGHKTAKGPGRHNISSAFFWYFETPLDAMFEYSSNEDFFTDKWKPREIKWNATLTTSETFI